MNKIDKMLKSRIKSAAPEMPEDMSVRINEMVNSLDVQPYKKRNSPFKTAVLVAFAAVVITFFILPNVNENIAYAMQDIPFIGEYIKVFSIYKKDKEDEYHFEHIDIPQVESESGLEEQIDYINKDVKELTQMAIDEYEKTISDLPDAHMGLEINYEVVTNTDEWFTLRVLIYQVAGSGSPQYKYYHIDKQRGELVSLSQIFTDSFNYVSVFSAEIKNQMQEQMLEDAKKIYWVYPDDNTCSGFYQIKPDQNFYFNENNELVIAFDKYEVAPGYMGCPEFVIPRELYESSFN